MDYEKEYKKLKAGISKAYLYAQTDSTKAVLENILPELAENGDERIRKELVAFFKEMRDTWHEIYWHDLQVEGILAWLEKQKDIEDRWIEDRGQCFWNGVEEGKMLAEKQKEQKPVEWSDDIEQAAARYERENRQCVLSSVDIVNAFIEGARWKEGR